MTGIPCVTGTGKCPSRTIAIFGIGVINPLSRQDLHAYPKCSIRFATKKGTFFDMRQIGSSPTHLAVDHAGKPQSTTRSSPSFLTVTRDEI